MRSLPARNFLPPAPNYVSHRLSRAAVWILCLLAGCLPPPISVYIGSGTLRVSRGFAFVEADGFYYLRAAYADSSLGARLRDSGVDHVDIDLVNGETVDGSCASLEAGSLCVCGDAFVRHISADSIRRIVILGRISSARMWEEMAAWSVLYGALAVTPGLTGENHRFNPWAAAIGASAGAGLGYLYTQMNRPREEVLFRGFTIMQEGKPVPVSPG